MRIDRKKRKKKNPQIANPTQTNQGTQRERAMGLDSLGDLEFNLILTKLGAEDIARSSCVNRRLRASASADSLWSHICARDLHLSTPIDHLNSPIASFKVNSLTQFTYSFQFFFIPKTNQTQFGFWVGFCFIPTCWFFISLVLFCSKSRSLLLLIWWAFFVFGFVCGFKPQK